MLKEMSFSAHSLDGVLVVKKKNKKHKIVDRLLKQWGPVKLKLS